MVAIDHSGPPPLANQPQTLVILGWLRTRLTAREIANELLISMNALKTHLKSIYRKLGVTTRAEAVTRATSPQGSCRPAESPRQE
jgi:LuxR family maltose regulon positive regulatory protein